MSLDQPDQFSDYLVFVDESGDHGMANINRDFPLFALTFCVFAKAAYVEGLTPALRRLKLATFGHDMLVLHEHDLRKKEGAFARMCREPREAFLDSLTRIIADASFTLIAVVIDKRELQPAMTLANPYHLALLFGLERVFRLLAERGDERRVTHIIVEARGKREDTELELEFHRICEGTSGLGHRLPPIGDCRQTDELGRAATGRHGGAACGIVSAAPRPAKPGNGCFAAEAVAGSGRTGRGLRLEVSSPEKRRATGKSR